MEGQKKQARWDYPSWCGLCGGCAGVLTDLCVYPLDTLKTSIQAAGWKMKAVDRKSSGRLYAGLEVALAGTFIWNSLFFFFYELINTNLLKFNEKYQLSTTWVHVGAASAAEMIAITARNPFEVVKQNRQFSEFSNTWRGIRQIMKERGIKGFYAGYSALFFREIPFTIIEIPLYEWCIGKYLQYSDGNKQSIGRGASALSGAISGIAAGFITTPVDVIKSRMMTNTLKLHNRSFLDWGKTIYAEGGLLSLFKGGLIRAVFLGLGGIIFFMVYTEGLKVTNIESRYVQMRK